MRRRSRERGEKEVQGKGGGLHSALIEDSPRDHRTPAKNAQRIPNGLAEGSQRIHGALAEESQKMRRGFKENSKRPPKARGFKGASKRV